MDQTLGGLTMERWSTLQETGIPVHIGDAVISKVLDTIWFIGSQGHCLGSTMSATANS